ncbi:hypothetical protein SERLA73DRAFT_137943 [Serpula lacrymans var. lacrymans S7.3]|uniref:Uncharacterized protein n=1 Tax=Serpula lacrymans var. lacrymans (strain S7.3) TaxID=936435 RepID=F8Q0J1_SERL3|nr:hypothetical protein SERLA73DRAFT_137943 [Serpula lacrymans var. lacrymans S7.3]
MTFTLYHNYTSRILYALPSARFKPPSVQFWACASAALSFSSPTLITSRPYFSIKFHLSIHPPVSDENLMDRGKIRNAGYADVWKM